MSVKPEKLTRIGVILMYLLAFIYLVSICWINFHGALWCQMDVYTYAFEGRLMHEARSWFPEGWIFGNQYHIISSPNVSALFYGLVHDSMTSLAIASSLSMLLILLSFWWSFHKYTTKPGMAAGLLCLVGGIVFGTSASRYISGLQVLYTMASFYASYVLVLILTVGCWLRLRNGDKTPWLMIGIILVLNFAAGMQSLREMLVLVIPLGVIEGITFLIRLAKKASFKELVLQNRCLLFVLAIFIVELAGHFFMNALHVATTPIIGDVTLDLSPASVLANGWASAKNILRISGLAIASDGLKYLPLSICALAILACIIWSIVHIVRTKDNGPLSISIVFSAISVIGVFFVGTFLMRTRDIYYFVYWLLATLSVVYFLDSVKNKFWIPCIGTLLVVCAINYSYNFIPDFKDYHLHHKKLEAFAKSLADRGVKVIYVNATPILAAASQDCIISQSIWLDVNLQSGYPLTVFPSDKYVPAFDDEHYQDALICLSGGALSFLPTAPDSYKEELNSRLEYFDEIVLGARKFVLFKPVDRVIEPITAHAEIH